MKWLVLLYALEAGWMPQNLYDRSGTVPDHPVFAYTQFEADALMFGHLFAGGSLMTSMIVRNATTYEPRLATYEFRVGLRFDNLEVGFRHLCGPHSVVVYPQWNTAIKTNATIEGGYEQVYIRISNKN